MTSGGNYDMGHGGSMTRDMEAPMTSGMTRDMDGLMTGHEGNNYQGHGGRHL